MLPHEAPERFPPCDVYGCPARASYAHRRYRLALCNADWNRYGRGADWFRLDAGDAVRIALEAGRRSVVPPAGRGAVPGGSVALPPVEARPIPGVSGRGPIGPSRVPPPGFVVPAMLLLFLFFLIALARVIL